MSRCKTKNIRCITIEIVLCREIRHKKNIISILHNPIHHPSPIIHHPSSIIHHPSPINHESLFQHHKIRKRYGVLRHADISPLPRDCVFLLRKDLGGTRQRFHRRKYRVCCSVEGLWIWIGQGSVSPA